MSWDKIKLGELSRINYGYTEKASLKNIGPKFLRITDIQDNQVIWDNVPFCKIDEEEFPKYSLKEGDIVFARTGATTGKSFLISNPPKAVFASYLIRVQILDVNRLLPEFLYLFFQTKSYWDKIQSGLTGSTQGGFNATKLSELVIPLPSISEQKSIILLLNNIQTQTKKLEDIYKSKIDNLEELNKSILQKAFAGELTYSSIVANKILEAI